MRENKNRNTKANSSGFSSFRTVFGFELSSYFKNKIFVGITILIVAVVAVVMFLPQIASAFSSEDTEVTSEGVILVACEDGGAQQVVYEMFRECFPSYEVRLVSPDSEAIRQTVETEEADYAFLVGDISTCSYTYYVRNIGLYDSYTTVADELVTSLYRLNAMVEMGLSEEEAGTLLSAYATHETEVLGVNQMQNFFFAYIMVFALYMVILMYGQMVAMGVAAEKSTKAMELLITSASPESLMFGKIMAACAAGAIQLLLMFGSALLFYGMNSASYDDDSIIKLIFGMPVTLLWQMLVFFVLGFLIYAFLYGAIGSTVSKLEDINTAVMPITLIFIVAFFVVVFSLTSSNVDTTLMKLCSFIPFTSPMAMFTRIAMSSVPVWQILISIGILILSVIAVGILAAKIYRAGVLMYGKTPKPFEVVKLLARKQ